MSETTGARERRPRSDVQRNRSRILDVAERHFSEHGIAGSLDAIAKRAGIGPGPGTLYRHFPSKDALLAALLEAREEELAHRLDALRRDGGNSTEALTGWLDPLGRWATAFDGLPEPLRIALTENTSPLALTCQGYHHHRGIPASCPARRRRPSRHTGPRSLPRRTGDELGSRGRDGR